jgi:hypothetical protein
MRERILEKNPDASLPETAPPDAVRALAAYERIGREARQPGYEFTQETQEAALQAKQDAILQETANTQAGLPVDSMLTKSPIWLDAILGTRAVHPNFTGLGRGNIGLAHAAALSRQPNRVATGAESSIGDPLSRIGDRPWQPSLGYNEEAMQAYEAKKAAGMAALQELLDSGYGAGPKSGGGRTADYTKLPQVADQAKFDKARAKRQQVQDVRSLQRRANRLAGGDILTRGIQEKAAVNEPLIPWKEAVLTGTDPRRIAAEQLNALALLVQNGQPLTPALETEVIELLEQGLAQGAGTPPVPDGEISFRDAPGVVGRLALSPGLRQLGITETSRDGEVAGALWRVYSRGGKVDDTTLRELKRYIAARQVHEPGFGASINAPELAEMMQALDSDKPNASLSQTAAAIRERRRTPPRMGIYQGMVPMY